MLPRAEEAQCEQTHEFLPCTTTVFGNLFLVLAYGFLMFKAATYLSPNDHVTRDIREGIAKLGDLRFWALDSAGGLETEATSGTILSRTTAMTASSLARTQFALFLIDVRDGLQPLDYVGKWMRKHASGIHTVLVKGLLAAATGEAYSLGFGVWAWWNFMRTEMWCLWTCSYQEI